MKDANIVVPRFRELLASPEVGQQELALLALADYLWLVLAERQLDVPTMRAFRRISGSVVSLHGYIVSYQELLDADDPREHINQRIISRLGLTELPPPIVLPATQQPIDES